MAKEFYRKKQDLTRTRFRARTPKPEVTISEKPFQEIPRVVDTLGLVQEALNTTLETSFSFRVKETDGKPANIHFLSKEDMLKKSRENDIENSSIIKCLVKAGLPYEFAFIHGKNTMLASLYINGEIFFSEEYIKYFKVSPTTLAKQVVADTARRLFYYVALEAIKSTREVKPIIGDPDLIDRDLEKLQILALSKLSKTGTENHQGTADYISEVTQGAKSQGRLTYRAIGGEIELRDPDGLVLQEFADYDTVALRILIEACEERFDKDMRGKFPWYKPSEKPPQLPHVQRQLTATVVRKLNMISDTSNIPRLYQDYRSSRIGQEVQRRRKKYKDWRQEKEERKEEVSKLRQGLYTAVTLEAGKLSHLLGRVDDYKQSEMLIRIANERLLREARLAEIRVASPTPTVEEPGSSRDSRAEDIKPTSPVGGAIIFGQIPDEERPQAQPRKLRRRRFDDGEDNF